MGLDMYLFKETKADRAKRKAFEQKERALNEKWTPIFKAMPKIEFKPWEVDHSKMTPEQESNYKTMDAEYNALRDSRDFKFEEVAYWRKFNALHGYIVRTFAAGVDECQEITIGGADRLMTVINALEDTFDRLKLNDYDDEYLPVHPVGGFFFGSTEVDEWFVSDVSKAIDTLQCIYDSMTDDDLLVYQASW